MSRITIEPPRVEVPDISDDKLRVVILWQQIGLREEALRCRDGVQDLVERSPRVHKVRCLRDEAFQHVRPVAQDLRSARLTEHHRTVTGDEYGWSKILHAAEG